MCCILTFCLDSMCDPCIDYMMLLTGLISDWNYRVKIELYYLMVTIARQEHNTRGEQEATVLDWLSEEVHHTNFY